MKIKSLVAAATIAASSFGAFADTTFNVGNLTDLGDAGYGVTRNISAGSFIDIFTFTISNGTNSFASAASKVSAMASQEIQSFTGLLTGPSFSQSLVPSLSGFNQTVGYDGNLFAGDYSLKLTGTFARTGHYAVSLIAAPVPEPETFAMLLAGLGLMGAIALRRNKTSA